MSPLDEILDDILGELGMCGCGIPEDVLEWVVGYLELLEARAVAGWSDASVGAVKDHVETICPNYGVAHHAILYWLDSRGMLEHGSSIGGSWLKPKALDLIAKIRLLQPADRPRSS